MDENKNKNKYFLFIFIFYFHKIIMFQFRSVRFKMVTMRSGKPICNPHRL